MNKQLYDQFCLLVAKLSDTLTLREVIDVLRSKHSQELSDVTQQIVDNAIVNIRRNVLRRRANCIVEGIGDLFEKYNLPSRIPVPVQNKGKYSKVAPEHLTKSEVRLLIQEYANRPVRKNRFLVELEKIYDDIDQHCSDDETVGVALRRRRAKM